MDLIPQLGEKSIRACITSPPYANQRTGDSSTQTVFYDGVPVEDYPRWTLDWMNSLRPKLTDDGSVFIVIRPHLRKGVISDYVLKTRLALREAGWCECEELIWLKPDAPPLGSIYRPRRTWEQILWFSLSGSPFADLKACGNKKSNRVGGYAGSDRFGEGSVTAKGQVRELKKGVSRCTDVFTAYVGEIESGVMHPAMYPTSLTDQLVQTFTEKGDLVLDPFMGSGQTALSCVRFDRHFVGFDSCDEYVQIAQNRILAEKDSHDGLQPN